MPTGKRLLLVGHDVTLAHLARPLTLGKAAVEAGWETHLASSRRISTVPHDFAGITHALETVDAPRFARRLALGSPLFPASELQQQFSEDLALLDRVRPTIIVGDFRPSMAVAARVRSIPFANLCNAYWTSWADARFDVPELPGLSQFGDGIGQLLFDLGRKPVFAIHARPLRRLYRKHGLVPPAPTLGDLYTAGDFRLFSDLPELYPDKPLPTDSRFLGPVQWAPDLPPPAWWHELDSHAPTAYVCLGSSGRQDRLPMILDALTTGTNLQCIVVGPSELSTAKPGRIFAAPILAGDQAAARADLVVCNGGSPTAYQALAQGKPVLGVASNLDQNLNMYFLARQGAGIRQASQSLRAPDFLGEIETLRSDGPRNAAARLAERIADAPATEAFVRFLETQ